jgi:transcriptional regulator
MYDLPYYKEKDHALIIDFISKNPFALLIGSGNNVPVATQVPFLIEETGDKLFLLGHIMKGTDHHKAFLANTAALCVFTGAHAYVSASWYANQQTASTWNYMSVHASGQLQFMDEAALLQLLEKTTAHFENDPQSPASFHHLPKGYIDKLAKAIIGFKIEVNKLDAIFKLSQNRDKESYTHIIEELEKSDEAGKEVALAMKERITKVFP